MCQSHRPLRREASRYFPGFPSAPNHQFATKKMPTDVQIFMLDRFLVIYINQIFTIMIFTEVIRIFTLDRFCILQLTSTSTPVDHSPQTYRYMIKLSYSFPDCEAIGNQTTGPADVTKTSFDSITIGHLAPGRNHPSIYIFTAFEIQRIWLSQLRQTHTDSYSPHNSSFGYKPKMRQIRKNRLDVFGKFHLVGPSV